MIIAEHSRMDPSRDAQCFDIGAEAAQKVVSQTGGLRFVKQETLVQVVKGFFGDPDHPRPNAALTSSQFIREAPPREARSRLPSRSFLTSSGTGMASKCSCISCQMVSMMRTFCPMVMVLTSEIVIKLICSMLLFRGQVARKNYPRLEGGVWEGAFGERQ